MMFIILLIALVPIYFILKRNGERRPDALEILRLRYARGEITREEYDKLRNDLLN